MKFSNRQIFHVRTKGAKGANQPLEPSRNLRIAPESRHGRNRDKMETMGTNATSSMTTTTTMITTMMIITMTVTMTDKALKEILEKLGV